MPLGQASQNAMTQAGNAAQRGKQHPLAEDFVDYGGDEVIVERRSQETVIDSGFF